MASNRQTTWGANNLVIEQDYTFKFNEIVAGDPELYIEIQPEDSEEDDVVDIVTWRHAVRVETASWRYIGMDYATAMSCANSMRNTLTHSKYVWEFGVYVKNGVVKNGWYKAASMPTLESDVAIVKNGIGDMYDVVVQAQMTSDEYDKNPNINITGSRPLAGVLGHVAGWNNSVTPTNGKYFNAASADNISLVSSPTWKREFEIAGVDYTGLVPDEQSPIGYSFPLWYKVRTTYQCQVKFEGMTRAACKNLFNTLNGTSGWWYKYHPYEYKAQSSGGNVTFVWTEDTTKWCYQCLNEFKAHPSYGNLWTAELSLTCWQDSYTQNPSGTFTPSWPTCWNVVPGISQFL